MELTPFFRSVLEEDRCPVVLCGLDHTILYMNPAACTQYHKWGGAGLLGRSLLDCHNADSNEKIARVLDWFRADRANDRVYTAHNAKQNKDVYMIALRDESGELIGYYEKHEYRDPETMPLYHLEEN